HDQYGLDVRIARLFNSYGPRLRAEGLYGRVISRFILQALQGEDITVFGDGSQTRSFSYVTDTVSASLLFMGLDRSSEKVLNIGTKEENNIRDLAERIKAIAVSDSSIRFLPLPAGDHMRRLPDTARMERLLGWSLSIRLETGLDRTLDGSAPKNPSSSRWNAYTRFRKASLFDKCIGKAFELAKNRGGS